MRSIIQTNLILFTLMLLANCTPSAKHTPTDTLTSGTTTLCIDDSYSFLFETLTRVFEDQNPEAKINLRLKNETESIKSLMEDSCKVIVLNRELTKNETAVFNSKNIYPKCIKFAYDAVALIIHPENNDTLLDLEDLKSVLTGKITKWDQLGQNGKDEILIVFDKPNSANFRYMKDTLLKGAELQKNCFGVSHNKDVIDYVRKNKNAIGIISAGWITDDYSNAAKVFLNQIRVMAIGHKSSGLYYRPYQYYVHQNLYPFVRPVFLVSRQTRMGLGTGFVNFICKADKGQQIVAKSGLVPVYAYIREIKANVE